MLTNFSASSDKANFHSYRRTYSTKVVSSHFHQVRYGSSPGASSCRPCRDAADGHLADPGQNDHIFISHYHDPEDGFANLEEGSEWVEDDQASLSSVVHRSAVTQSPILTNRQLLFAAEVTKPALEEGLLKLTVLYRMLECWQS